MQRVNCPFERFIGSGECYCCVRSLSGNATLPVRVISITPNVFIRSRNFSTLLSAPVISMVRLLGCTSTILARKMSVICITSARDLGIHRHLHQHQFAVHVFALAEILHLDDVRQLVELLDDLFQRGLVAVRDDGHARDVFGSCVGRDVERVNVVAASAEQAGHAREQVGNQVTLSYRKEAFSRIKERNAQRIQESIRKGKVKVVFNSIPTEFKEKSVILDVNGKSEEIPNDYVWIFAGGEPPTAFLKKIGVGFGAQDLTSTGAREVKAAKEATLVHA